MLHGRPLIVAAALLCGALSHAQYDGKVRFQVDPGHDYQLRIDGGKMMQVRELDLSPGLHRVSVWAPGRMVKDTSLTVVQDRMIDFRVSLAYNPEYVNYLREKGKYDRRMKRARGIPLLATAATGALAYVSYRGHVRAYNRLDSLVSEYGRAMEPTRVTWLKQEAIPEAKADLKTSRRNVAVTTALSLACVGGTILMFKRSAKWDRPTFDDGQRVIFESLAWVPQPGAPASLQLQLVLR